VTRIPATVIATAPRARSGWSRPAANTKAERLEGPALPRPDPQVLNISTKLIEKAAFSEVLTGL